MAPNTSYRPMYHVQLMVRIGNHRALGLKTAQVITRLHIDDGVPHGRGPTVKHPIHLMRPCVPAAAVAAALLAVLESNRGTRRPKTSALRQQREQKCTHTYCRHAHKQYTLMET